MRKQFVDSFLSAEFSDHLFAVYFNANMFEHSECSERIPWRICEKCRFVLMRCIDLPGSPQRVNGKVKGKIFVGNNPVPVIFENTDLHSYVVMNQGRAYTAISTIPETLGYSLLPLASIGGIIGWMFAVEQQGYKNGFSVTGNF